MIALKRVFTLTSYRVLNVKFRSLNRGSSKLSEASVQCKDTFIFVFNGYQRKITY